MSGVSGRLASCVVAVVVLLVIIISVCANCSPRDYKKSPFRGGEGPYGMELYDSPYYYPYYQSRDYTEAWDLNGRCSAYCRGDGCAVECR